MTSLKYIEDSHLGFSEIVRFSVNHREAIVAKLVLSLTRLSFQPCLSSYTGGAGDGTSEWGLGRTKNVQCKETYSTEAFSGE